MRLTSSEEEFSTTSKSGSKVAGLDPCEEASGLKAACVGVYIGWLSFVTVGQFVILFDFVVFYAYGSTIYLELVYKKNYFSIRNQTEI